MSTADEASYRHRGGAPGNTSSNFNNATGTHITNSTIVTNHIQNLSRDAVSDLLKTLYDQVAMNAISNDGGRVDEIKCYPGTREEVIDLAERWMGGVDGVAPNLMWLSGPAGAGKTAIVQTILERWKDRERKKTRSLVSQSGSAGLQESGIHAASFFFFREDPTRSTARPLVATLLYQILKFYPIAREAVANVLSNDPLLFHSSVQNQFDHLLAPLQDVLQAPEFRARRPIVLLIDGLDECDSEKVSSQKQVLQALDRLLTQVGSPFLALVASRAEPHVRMAFKKLSSPIQPLFLDVQYRPEKDIRLFVTGEFDNIKQSHHLAYTLGDDWPSDSDIEFIVKKSSGQFIFAATVMRFLADSPASPLLNLEIVQGVVPVTTNTPFARLDAVYTYILSRVDDRGAVLDLLATKLLIDSKRLQLDLRTVLKAYNPGYTPEFLLSCVANLTAIMEFNEGNLDFFHASLPDFLSDESRAGEFFIDINTFGVKIQPTVQRMTEEQRDSDVVSASMPTNKALTEHRHVGGAPDNTSIFENTTNTPITNSPFNVIKGTQPSDDVLSHSLKTLYNHLAPNAILNAGGRADEARCYPGTREEVIGLVERWMDHPDGVANLTWLSGPAGAGKTALVQTIAERCKDRGVQAASFFFFRGDATRSTARPLVATLLYQIFRFYPAAREVVANVLSNDPLLFESSVQDQFDQLLAPLQDFLQAPESGARRPIVLLIDGLDECDSEHKSSQREIVHALDRLLTLKGSPFIALVASRVESHIRRAFKQLSSPVQSVYLDDEYRPENDIRLFVTAEFSKIKDSHYLAHTLASDWPSEEDIESIVKKSSGQFIYAATVMRYLANSSASPKLSLERVHGIEPVTNDTPFAQLDAIYTYIFLRVHEQDTIYASILSRVPDRGAVDIMETTSFVYLDAIYAHIFSQVHDRDALLALLAMQLLNNSGLLVKRMVLTTILNAYNPRYTPELLLSCIGNLTAVIQFDGNDITFLHASLPIFLQDQSRAGEFYIDIRAFGVKILPTIWMMTPGSMAETYFGLQLLDGLTTPTPDVTKMYLTVLPHANLDSRYHNPLMNRVFQTIHKLYLRHDVETYKKILCHWVSWYLRMFPSAATEMSAETLSLPDMKMIMFHQMARKEFQGVTNALK